jgi:hypothetical protein
MISAPWVGGLIDIENGFQFIGEVDPRCQRENDNPFQKVRACGQMVSGSCGLCWKLSGAKGSSVAAGDVP